MDLTDSGGTDGLKTDMGWEIWPDGFYELLMRISREYKSMPMEITENEASYLDGPDSHGKIPDTRRVEYLRGYLSALGRAMKDGASEHLQVPPLEFARQFRTGGRVHAAI